MVDFSKNCSVLFFFENEQSEGITMKYERLQIIDDFTLTEEAKVNAQDMVKKRLNGAKELIKIGIARSERQYREMTKKASSDFI